MENISFPAQVSKDLVMKLFNLIKERAGETREQARSWFLLARTLIVLSYLTHFISLDLFYVPREGIQISSLYLKESVGIWGRMQKGWPWFLRNKCAMLILGFSIWLGSPKHAEIELLLINREGPLFFPLSLLRTRLVRHPCRGMKEWGEWSQWYIHLVILPTWTITVCYPTATQETKMAGSQIQWCVWVMALTEAPPPSISWYLPNFL